VRRDAEPIQHQTAVHDRTRGRRIIEDDDERGGFVRSTATHAHERARRREHDHDEQRRAEDEQEQVAQLEAPRALAFGCTEIANRREIELGWNTALQQMQQGWDRSGRESQQSQRMNERHVSRRRAIPNGMSVCTWWYAMP
jgi:hypothetical protein